jgi:hypothetical protein
MLILGALCDILTTDTYDDAQRNTTPGKSANRRGEMWFISHGAAPKVDALDY